MTISELKSIILNNTLLVANGDDDVRACLIYVLCQGFLGKKFVTPIKNHDKFELLKTFPKPLNHYKLVSKMYNIRVYPET